ncbi:MAG TPA: NAD-dependent epimerase/dehydratase family protein, partial [Thermoanaerobaculia bacterium]|nr:NAD-dependent epimerase/dehydratase family protein [Thermoanaerobaculia bacterium]
MITVLGASGFVGSHVVEHLRRERIEHQAPARGETLAGRALGHVIYCIGVTDFRERPWDAVDAHVCTLLDVVRYCTYESILYLSSIRVYAGVHGVAREQDALSLNPLDFSELYGISKVA